MKTAILVIFLVGLQLKLKECKSFYFVKSRRLTWSNALNFCRMRNGSLAELSVPLDYSLQSFITSSLRQGRCSESINFLHCSVRDFFQVAVCVRSTVS